MKRLLIVLACVLVPLNAMAEKWQEVKRLGNMIIYVDKDSVEYPSPGGPIFVKSVYNWDDGATGDQKESQKIVYSGHDCKAGGTIHRVCQAL